MANVLAEELRRYYEEIEPYEFWREIFGDGSLDEADAFTPGKYTAIALEITDKHKMVEVNGIEKKKQIVYRHSVTNDLDKIDELLSSPYFCAMAPISYAGKTRKSDRAREMYALCVELDNLKTRVRSDGSVWQIGLDNLMDRFDETRHFIPKPTYIVASGSGLHLYYLWEKPLVLFPNTVRTLKAFKEELTWMIWHESVTNSYKENEVQQESIFQPFRMPGTRTKTGDKAVAFRVGEPVSIDYMNSFMRLSLKGKCNIEGTYKNDLTLAKAKELYPKWYETRIIQGDKTRKKWAVSRNVYDWWLRRIKDEAIDGHRFHCLKMLAIYAIKCNKYDEKKNPNPVTQEEFEADCWSLFEEFKARGKRADNPFTEYDILCALQVYEDEGFFTYPVNSIAYKSGIKVEKNDRKKQKREWHLEDMRTKKVNMKRRGQAFKNPEGRPKGSGTAEQKVKEWRRNNPEGTKSQCKEDTGLTYPTIRKWWD